MLLRSLLLFFSLLLATTFSLNDTVPLSLLLTLSLVSPPSCRSLFISIIGPLWLLPPGICCLSWMISLFRSLTIHRLLLPPAWAFFYISSKRALPSHPSPLVNRYGPKSHCTSAVRKNIFQSACLHAAHIAMHLEIWGALQGWKKLNSDAETWLVIFRVLDMGVGYTEKCNTPFSLILTQIFIRSCLFWSPLWSVFFFMPVPGLTPSSSVGLILWWENSPLIAFSGKRNFTKLCFVQLNNPQL